MIRCIQTFFSLGLCVAATAATPQFFDADVESAVPDVHEALLLTDSQKAYFDDIYAQLRPRYGIVDEAEFRRRGLKALSAPQLQLIADIEEAIAGIRAKVEAEFAKNSNPIEHLAVRQKRETIAMRMAWQLPAVLTPLQRQAVAVAKQQTPETVQAPPAEMPAIEMPLEDFSTDEMPLEDFSADEMPVEDFPTDEMPVEDFPTDEMPVEDFPADEMPLEDFPADEMPVEDFPTDEMPVEDFPADEMPTADVPTDEMPTADVRPMDVPTTEALPPDVQPTAMSPTDMGTTDSAHQPSQPAEKDISEFLEDNIGNKTRVRGFEATTDPNLLGKKAKIGGFEVETSPNLLGKKAKIGGFEIVIPPRRLNDEEKAEEKVSDSRNPVPDQ